MEVTRGASLLGFPQLLISCGTASVISARSTGVILQPIPAGLTIVCRLDKPATKERWLVPIGGFGGVMNDFLNQKEVWGQEWTKVPRGECSRLILRDILAAARPALPVCLADVARVMTLRANCCADLTPAGLTWKLLIFCPN